MQPGNAQAGSRSDHRNRGTCCWLAAADLPQLVRLQSGHRQRKRGEIVDHMQPIERQSLARSFDRESPRAVGQLYEIAGEPGGHVERGFANPGASMIGKVAANRLLEALELGAPHHLLLLRLPGAVGDQRETRVGPADVTDQPQLAHRYSSFRPPPAASKFRYSTPLTATTTPSTVNPKNLNRSPAGADSPKRSSPTTAPSSPTYLRQ